MHAETPPDNRCSVLIVDDEEGPHRALEYGLQPHFRVVTAYCHTNAFRAILDNAIKFTRQGGVTVTLRRDARSRLEIGVCDTGIGIGKDHDPRVFRKCYQEDSVTRRQAPCGPSRAIRAVARCFA